MPHAVREMLHVAPGQRDHVPAVRIALSVAVPLVVLVAMGREDLTIYACFGAFTSIYGRHLPTRQRLSVQLRAGVILLVAVMLGALLSTLAAPQPVVLGATALVASVGAVLAAAWRLTPAGSLFFIFASGAIGSLGPDAVAPLGTALLVTLSSICLSVLLGLVWRYLGEGPLGDAGPTRPAATLPRQQLAGHGGRFLVATAVAGVAGSVVGASHTYWAQVAAAAPIAAPTHRARLQRGLHRMVGTLGGVGVTAFVLSMHLQTWHLVVFVVLFQWLAEMFIGRNYSVALLFVTPLALLMSQLAMPTDGSELLSARALETVVGALCGMAVVYVWRTRSERRADDEALVRLRRAADEEDVDR
ncbi:FUSC family protein [Kytococcus sp. Marseille-QA3725]